MATKSLKGRVKYRINRSKDSVFTPKDFLDLSGRDQVGRAFRQLVLAGELAKLGQSLYAKAKRSKLTVKTIPVKPLPEFAKEALTVNIDRLTWLNNATGFEKNYQARFSRRSLHSQRTPTANSYQLFKARLALRPHISASWPKGLHFIFFRKTTKNSTIGT